VPRPTKQAVIDELVSAATKGKFTGDDRDGKAPRITPSNFDRESIRYGARAYRAGLAQLSLAELLRKRDERTRFDEEETERGRQAAARLLQAYRQKQADRGRRNKRQPEILEAARHYRGRVTGGRKMTAGDAWDAIKNSPFRTGRGWVVLVSGYKSERLKQEMRAMSLDRSQTKRPIVFSTWRQLYWPAS
jgi:hypothetical protein